MNQRQKNDHSLFEIEQATREQVEEEIRNEIIKIFRNLENDGVFILDKNTVNKKTRDLII